MQLIRGLHALPTDWRPHAVTIGNFDGVHRGHQAMVRQLQAAAAARHLPSLVVCFEPQPQEYFRGDQAPSRIMTWRDKVDVLRSYGVDAVLLLRFNESLQRLSGPDFIEHLLVSKLKAAYVLVGDDFRFGCDRRGDYELLANHAERFGYSVGQLDTIDDGHERFSSTRLREQLSIGDFAASELQMGRPFQVTGKVQHGDKLGRTLSFPTANVLMRRRVLPLRGVFAVEVDGIAAHPVRGVANVGTRPTVQGIQARCEVHLLDFSGDIYGRRVAVRFCRKLRDEQRFASLDALKQAIAADVTAAHTFFAGK